MQLLFKIITLVGSNQGNFFENAATCSKRMLKTLVATQLYATEIHEYIVSKSFFLTSVGIHKTS